LRIGHWFIYEISEGPQVLEELSKDVPVAANTQFQARGEQGNASEK